jgi:predicted O-linked N-acetylglucosamine transferase (SPINDLY family)
MGDLLMLSKDGPAALAALERAANLQPTKPEPFARLVDARLQVCEWRKYDADIDRLTADVERQLAAGEATAVVPFQALTLPWPPQRVLAIARSHSDAVALQLRERGQLLKFQHSRTRTGRLRVGYLSGDFYDHPISHQLLGVFGKHERARFEVFAYSFGPDDRSAYRQRIQADCEHFVDIAGLSVPATARRIAADGIHVLVDLMGHTGFNRLAAIAQRPAPVQVNYLGHAGTTGADFIDYLIGDPVTTPPDRAADYREKLAILLHCYMATDNEQRIADSAGSRSDHGLPDGTTVFCAFNKSYKIEPRMFGVWMRILAQEPDSVLWLWQAAPLVEGNLRREAEARGVAGNRLVFARWVPGKAEHLARHRLADLFLDTLIYNGHTTACDALWAGLPVLTCPGETFASRVGAGVLSAVGLPELIAQNLEEYERMAVELASRPEALREVREKLAGLRKSAPLFDTLRFVRNLERAYLAMWDTYAAGGPPRMIEVAETDKG